MPKSSMAMRAPSDRSWARNSAACSGSGRMPLSVTSNPMSDGSTPVVRKMREICSTTAADPSWVGDRFTHTTNGSVRPTFQQLADSHARVSTVSNRAGMRPTSSATGMNSTGGRLPPVGASHRASASAPMTLPSCSRTVGWKCTTMPPWSMASRRAPSMRTRSAPASSIWSSNTSTRPRPFSLAW